MIFAGSNAATYARKAPASLPTLTLNYNVGINNWNTTLDPAETALTNDADTEMLMNAGLVRILPPAKTNGSIKVVLDLANKVTLSKDRKTYTFHIRPNAKFADGHKVTATDVVWSITRSAGKDVDPQEADTYDNLITGLDEYNQGTVKKISGLKAVNASTVQIHIDKPAAYFFAAFAYSSNYVLEKKLIQGHKIGDITTTCKLNKGAGPFVPVCQNGTSDTTSFFPAGSTPTLTLKPNKYYYGPKPKIQVKLPVVSAPETWYNEYKAGSVATSAISVPSDLPSWKGKKDYTQWGTSVVWWVQTDVTSAPFNNVHCRLAVAHAIDRATIVTKIVPGFEKQYYTVVPPGFLSWWNAKPTLNKKGGTPWYSLSLAKKELSQCPGGINVTWPYRTTTATGRAIRDAIGSMLDQAGIHVKFQDLTSQEYSRDQTSPMSQTGSKILRSGWQQDYPDPQDYVSLLLRTGQTYAITGWKNSTFNKLVDQANKEPSRKTRASLYQKAQKIALSQAVWMPLYNDVGNMLVKPYVHGLVGSSAYADLMPSGGNWAKVSVSKH